MEDSYLCAVDTFVLLATTLKNAKTTVFLNFAFAQKSQ